MSDINPYYDKDGITIFCGDCLEIMPQLNMKFDAIIADLPYGTTACSWDVIIPFNLLWENYDRLIKKNRAMVLFGNQPFTTLLISSNVDRFKYNWVWKKTHSPHFLLAKYRPLGIHEDIIIFGSKSVVYNPQITKGKRKLNRSGNFSNLNRNHADFGLDIKILEFVESFDYFPKSVLEISSIKRADLLHPTQKPEALLQYLIRTYTNEGDIVLDNTMGSGTTLVTAKAENREAVGIDIEEKYCEIAVKRLEGYTPKEIKNNINIINKRLF